MGRGECSGLGVTPGGTGSSNLWSFPRGRERAADSLLTRPQNSATEIALGKEEKKSEELLNFLQQKNTIEN